MDKLPGLSRHVAVRDIIARHFANRPCTAYNDCEIHLSTVPLPRWLRLLRKAEGTSIDAGADERVNKLIAMNLQRRGIYETQFLDKYEPFAALDAARDALAVAYPELTFLFDADHFRVETNAPVSEELYHYVR